MGSHLARPRPAGSCAPSMLTNFFPPIRRATLGDTQVSPRLFINNECVQLKNRVLCLRGAVCVCVSSEESVREQELIACSFQSGSRHLTTEGKGGTSASHRKQLSFLPTCVLR